MKNILGVDTPKTRPREGRKPTFDSPLQTGKSPAASFFIAVPAPANGNPVRTPSFVPAFDGSQDGDHSELGLCMP